MKLQNIFRLASIAVASGSMLLGVTSCNYLDVVPPEQAGLSDAMKTPASAKGFLYSCYSFLGQREWQPRDYTGQLNGGTDEYCLPLVWYAEDGPLAYATMLNTQTTTSGGSGHGAFWYQYYTAIGQCLLFERELAGEGAKNEVCTAEEGRRWRAETRFLKAYYHFLALRQYGPIPLTTTLDLPNKANDYRGRTSFTTCVNYLANEFQAAADELHSLGFDVIEEENLGRASAVMALAMKGRLLMYAASPLWNGSFPYLEWAQQVDQDGNQLIPTTEDRSKWVRAYLACKAAVEAAHAAGHELWNLPVIPADEATVLPTDIYVPGGADDEFKAKIATMRYAVSTSVAEGNREIIWGIKNNTYGWKNARHPIGITNNASGKEANSWGGVAPTLFTVEHFLTKDGYIPANDPEYSKDFYGFSTVDKRPNIPNIALNREPRFYAWIAFNGGDYLTRIKNGKPLQQLDFIKNGPSAGKQGHVAGARNYTTTGFLSMKHIDPATRYMEDNTASTFEATGDKDSPSVLIRLAELYLNLAECAAAIYENEGEGDGVDQYVNDYPELASVDFKQEAIKYVNLVRERAGAALLSENHIGAENRYGNATSFTPRIMTLTEWVRNERFIEFMEEGQRYFDIRRWFRGEEYCGHLRRQGLNGVDTDISPNDFFKPIVIDQQYTFHKRQYLQPMFQDEVYANPNMLQAPGY